MDVPYRGQDDLFADVVSVETGVVFPDDEEGARQEFAVDADINVLLRRYGGLPPVRGEAQFAEVDFSQDLLEAHVAVERARSAYFDLPDDVRKLYPDWQSVQAAIDSGVLAFGSAPVAPAVGAAGAVPPPVGTAGSGDPVFL